MLINDIYNPHDLHYAYGMAIKKGSGFIPWNKGVTKEQNNKIAEQARQKSIWWAKLKKEHPRKYKKLCQNTGGKSRGKPGLKMEKNPRWIGGKYIDKRDKYVFIYMPKHPNARSDGYVLEHRLIMSNFLGRPIDKNEDINHINGKKDDNRLDNLRLVRHFAHYEEHKCPKCEFIFWTR